MSNLIPELSFKSIEEGDSKSIELLLCIVFAYISASLEKKENCDLPSITVFKIMFLIFVH